MNQSISSWMAATYDSTAHQYRRDDEIHVAGEDHQRIYDLLLRTCAQFSRPISVLDLGCGTGRHFHCLRNVKRLVGVDVSPEMLREAENPVRATEIQIQKIELLCSDLSALSFPEHSFDLIICLGVFGNGCSLSPELLRQFYQWLNPAGVLLLDTFDPACLPPLKRIRKMLRWKLHTVLPRALQSAWIDFRGWPPCFYCTFIDLWHLAKSAGFDCFSLESIHCQMPQGPASKLQLSATKPNLSKASLSKPQNRKN